MKLKCPMEILDLDDSLMAVPLNGSENFNGVLRMNGTTADILRILQNDVTEDEIVAAMQAEYDASACDIRENVRKVLAVLRENDLLE